MKYNKTERNKHVDEILRKYGIIVEKISQKELNQRIKDKVEGYYITNGVNITVSKYNQFEPSDDEVI